MVPRKIIIDTDPGQDDAVAILLALACPEELEVLGIVTVGGNVSVEQNTINALKVVELSGKLSTPVYKGSSAPLHRMLTTAEHVHGDTGLNGPRLPKPVKKVNDKNGIEFIVDTCRAATEPITICALGPLTNLARAILHFPDITKKIEEFVIMGGGYFEGGNITPTAEFNIYVDPEAAKIVFGSGVKTTLLPLDVTHQALVTKERLEMFAQMNSMCGDAIFKMLGFSETFDRTKYGWDGAPLHDPAVIAYLLDPSIYDGRLVNVEVETKSELCRGQTVVDYWHVTDRLKNVQYMRDVDANRFFALLKHRIGRLR